MKEMPLKLQPLRCSCHLELENYFVKNSSTGAGHEVEHLLSV